VGSAIYGEQGTEVDDRSIGNFLTVWVMRWDREWMTKAKETVDVSEVGRQRDRLVRWVGLGNNGSRGWFARFPMQWRGLGITR
jgi:hypothetical protein